MDLSQVTLAQMRYAAAVEEARSFRLAAERSHVSQSGLSMQIQKLEELLDVRLFDRSRKPVLVTPEGEAAIAQMRAVLRETERLGQVVRDHGELAGPYRLGVIPTLAASVLPLFLRDFVETHPRVELTIEELQTEVILARLRADTLDAGIAATPLSSPGMQEIALGYEPLFAYLPPGDPLLRKKSVTERDLANRELWVMPEGHCFRTQVLSFCEAAARAERTNTKPTNTKPTNTEPTNTEPTNTEPTNTEPTNTEPTNTEPTRIRFESGSFETLMRLVDGGLGATVVPALVVQQLSDDKRDAQVRKLAGPTPTREIGLVTARADLRGRLNAALADLVRARLKEALGNKPKRARVLLPVTEE